MKNSFVLYTDYAEQIKLLTDSQCGILFRAIMAHETGEDLPQMDALTNMAFSVIRQRLERDSEAYEQKCERNRKNARMRWDATASERMPDNTVALGRIVSHGDNDHDNDHDNDIDKKKKREPRFLKPTLEEVAAYCAERKNRVDAEAFIDFYASKGWRVGSQPMKDWKAAVRTWEKRDNRTPAKKPNKFSNFPQRDYDYDALEAELLEVGR